MMVKTWHPWPTPAKQAWAESIREKKALGMALADAATHTKKGQARGIKVIRGNKRLRHVMDEIEKEGRR